MVSITSGAVTVVSAADLSECTELHSLRNLYLKPISRLVIVVTMPTLKIPGVTVSNWEIMERLKAMVAPDQFTHLKVEKSTLDLLTFDAEADSKTTLTKFLIKLDGKVIKLGNFAEPLRVRAARKKIPFPKKNDWNKFFRESNETNENKPGERPDTIYINHLPTKRFVENENDTKPSELVLKDVFSTFGEVRAVDIPSNDIYRDRIQMLEEAKKGNKENSTSVVAPVMPQQPVFKTFSKGSSIYFDCYIQYMDYAGFSKAMRAFKNKKLLYLIEEEKGATAPIEVDFDKTQHLSEKNIKRRDRRRDRLIRSDAEEEEKRKKEHEEQSRKHEIEILEKRRRELLELAEVQDALKLKEQRRLMREEKRKKKREQKRLVIKQKMEREKKIADLTESMKKQQKEEATILVIELLKRIAKRKQEEEIAEARRQAEILLRKQIEEKQRKLDEEKAKEEQLKKKRIHELDDEEEELKKRLKKIIMEKKEREKSKKEVYAKSKHTINSKSASSKFNSNKRR
ncbi:A-kinase anchor protein 17A [Hydra vulgaris]|nr:A-kinase anchor protein 17A [Hydra vulgaris]